MAAALCLQAPRLHQQITPRPIISLYVLVDDGISFSYCTVDDHNQDHSTLMLIIYIVNEEQWYTASKDFLLGLSLQKMRFKTIQVQP